MARRRRGRRDKVAVITGAGRAFSAGGDLELIDRQTKQLPRISGVMREAGDIVYNIAKCEKPMISAINGVAVGAGLVVALMADISIIAEEARITDGHIRLGVAAGDHAVIIWPLLCGMAKAKYYLLTSRLHRRQRSRADRSGQQVRAGRRRAPACARGRGEARCRPPDGVAVDETGAQRMDPHGVAELRRVPGLRDVGLLRRRRRRRSHRDQGEARAGVPVDAALSPPPADTGEPWRGHSQLTTLAVVRHPSSPVPRQV